MWSLLFEGVDMAIAAGNADTCMNAFIGGAEGLDTVRLLLQPIQLAVQCMTNSVLLHSLQLLYCFHGCFLLSNQRAVT